MHQDSYGASTRPRQKRFADMALRVATSILPQLLTSCEEDGPLPRRRIERLRRVAFLRNRPSRRSAPRAASEEAAVAVGADGLGVDDAHLAEIRLLGEAQIGVVIVGHVALPLDLVARHHVENAAPAALDAVGD